jgi:hypothetical protein
MLNHCAWESSFKRPAAGAIRAHRCRVAQSLRVVIFGFASNSRVWPLARSLH